MEKKNGIAVMKEKGPIHMRKEGGGRSPPRMTFVGNIFSEGRKSVLDVIKIANTARIAPR